MKQSEQTRSDILNQAFSMIYRYGYHATSVDTIMEKTGVTKGSFYYHFKNKEEMVEMMVKEVIKPRLSDLLIESLNPVEGDDQTDPIPRILESFKTALTGFSDDEVTHGCPINNLIQEMGTHSESIRKALVAVLQQWHQRILVHLEMAQQNGYLRKEIDVREVADFIISSYEGVRGIGKIFQGKALYQGFLNQWTLYFTCLKP